MTCVPGEEPKNRKREHKSSSYHCPAPDQIVVLSPFIVNNPFLQQIQFPPVIRLRNHFQNIQTRAPQQITPLNAFPVPSPFMISYSFFQQVMSFPGAPIYHQVKHVHETISLPKILPPLQSGHVAFK